MVILVHGSTTTILCVILYGDIANQIDDTSLKFRYYEMHCSNQITYLTSRADITHRLAM